MVLWVKKRGTRSDRRLNPRARLRLGVRVGSPRLSRLELEIEFERNRAISVRKMFTGSDETKQSKQAISPHTDRSVESGGLTAAERAHRRGTVLIRPSRKTYVRATRSQTQPHVKNVPRTLANVGAAVMNASVADDDTSPFVRTRSSATAESNRVRSAWRVRATQILRCETWKRRTDPFLQGKESESEGGISFLREFYILLGFEGFDASSEKERARNATRMRRKNVVVGNADRRLR